jgi:hypothetical protein
MRAEVVPQIQQHVGQRVPNLSRAAEHAQVVAFREHRAAARERAMHGSRDARADRFHPARKSRSVLRLDDQVNVITLERELRDAKLSALARRPEGAANLAHQGRAAKRRNARSHAPRHEAGKTPSEALAPAMPHARPRPRLAPGTDAPTTPTILRPKC